MNTSLAAELSNAQAKINARLEMSIKLTEISQLFNPRI